MDEAIDLLIFDDLGRIALPERGDWEIEEVWLGDIEGVELEGELI